MRRTFAVGRLTPESAEIVLLPEEADEEDVRRTRFPGPWSLRAIVRDLRPSIRVEKPGGPVH